MPSFNFKALLVDYGSPPEALKQLATPDENSVVLSVTDDNGPNGAADFKFDGDEDHLSIKIDGVDYNLTGLPMSYMGTGTLPDANGTPQSGSVFAITNKELASVLKGKYPGDYGSDDDSFTIFIPDNQSVNFNPGNAGHVQDYDDSNGAPFVCFVAGTLIQTVNSVRPIEGLVCGDQIMTVDNGLQPIRWIGSCRINPAELNAFPHLRPIRIRAKALSMLREDGPSRDLMVSPQHRILVRSKIAQRMFGTDEVLVAAKHLLECEGFEIAEDVTEVEYFHMLFDRHEIIYSNGVETESLHTGPQALKSVGPAAQEEIFTLFPELRDCDPTEARPLARPALTGREGRNFARRISKNKQPLFS